MRGSGWFSVLVCAPVPAVGLVNKSLGQKKIKEYLVGRDNEDALEGKNAGLRCHCQIFSLLRTTVLGFRSNPTTAARYVLL